MVEPVLTCCADGCYFEIAPVTESESEPVWPEYIDDIG